MRNAGKRKRERERERGYIRGYDDVHDYRDGCESEFYSLILFFFFFSFFFTCLWKRMLGILLGGVLFLF